jgi:hypothetical protein
VYAPVIGVAGVIVLATTSPVLNRLLLFFFVLLVLVLVLVLVGKAGL